jgi:hypothetical protein
MQQNIFSDIQETLKRTLTYVYSCRTEDGGYFFARIPPSSLRDSYFAVEVLKILGKRPLHPESLEQFVRSFLQDTTLQNIRNLYFSTEIFKNIGGNLESLRSNYKTVASSPWLYNCLNSSVKLYVEVESELEGVFQTVSSFMSLGIPFDQMAVMRLVSLLLNKDGSFGRRGGSPLATTYDAVRTLTLLGRYPKESECILSFLKRQEQNIYFLEDLFYLSSIYFNLGGKFPKSEWAISFVRECQRNSGGFARARLMGIATLEYTYYAISLFKQLGVF